MTATAELQRKRTEPIPRTGAGVEVVSQSGVREGLQDGRFSRTLAIDRNDAARVASALVSLVVVLSLISLLLSGGG